MTDQRKGSGSRRSPPAFQVYAEDWTGRREVKLMPLAERGLLISMLAQFWQDGC